MTTRPAQIVLSHFQAEPIVRARKEGIGTVPVSLDLGLSLSDVEITPEGVAFPGGERLAWSVIESIARSGNKCWLVRDGEAEAIQFFSETTNWVRTLMPTLGAPTMLASGLSMHRIKGTEPHKDTLLKVRTIAPIMGRVLDTATGLGYTAIEAARSADEVITIELDPAALEVARLNPWSRELFENPRIKQIVGDACEVIRGLASARFARVIHDPPAFSLGGEMYSAGFYAELFRVLERGGRLFHYIGDLESRSGRVISKGVVSRLQAAGFKGITRRPEAFGVVAHK